MRSSTTKYNRQVTLEISEIGMVELFAFLEFLELHCELSELVEGQLPQDVFLVGVLVLEEGEEELWVPVLDLVVVHHLSALTEWICLVLPHTIINNTNYNSKKLNAFGKIIVYSSLNFRLCFLPALRELVLDYFLSNEIVVDSLSVH